MMKRDIFNVLFLSLSLQSKDIVSIGCALKWKGKMFFLPSRCLLFYWVTLQRISGLQVV